jgi:hypothetical protein
MNFSNWTTVHESWKEENKTTLLSPPLDEHWEHIILCPDSKDADYAIEADLTLLHGEVLNNQLYKEAGVILRYSGSGQYYYAGLGAFGARTFIGMVRQQDNKSIWSCLASQGKKEEIEFDKPYKLRVECQGAKISLYESGKNRLAVEVDAYPTGYFGFRTLRTQARFSKISKSDPSVLKVFVIMPFTASLSFIYEIIDQVVKDQGLKCHRVDKSAISKPIIDDIKKWLTSADLIIADLTDKNPNVYYETGFAHALNKKLILIAQSPNDLAFNVRQIRTLFYRNPKELREGLEQALDETLAAERGSDKEKD